MMNNQRNWVNKVFKKQLKIYQFNRNKKLNALLNNIKQLLDQESFQIGCKNLVAQIKYDFQLVKDESKKYRNQELSHDILKFFTDSSYIIFKAQGEAEQIVKLDQLLIKYDNKLNEINNRKENINEKTTQDEINQINKLQTPFFKYDNEKIYQLSNSEYTKDLKADKVNGSILLSIKNTYKATTDKLVELIDLKSDHKVREGLAYNLIRLQYIIQEQQINQFSCKYIQFMWVFEKDQRVRNLLKNKELVEIQKQQFAQDFDIVKNNLFQIFFIDSDKNTME